LRVVSGPPGAPRIGFMRIVVRRIIALRIVTEAVA
jgi:hypothetical protein